MVKEKYIHLCETADDNEKALSYWQKASSIYPNAYKTRLEFFD